MGRPEEVAAGIKSGQSPQAIAQSIGVTHSSVVQYLQTAVGSELISRSEILFAIGDPAASLVEQLVAGGVRTLSELKRLLSAHWRTLAKATHEQKAGYRLLEENTLLYFRLREAPLADMYGSLCRLETFMHAYIKTQLERGYGPDWWRKGIPEGVRRDCVVAREEDPEPQEDPYCYTTFIHLRAIFDKQWGIFCKLLPKGHASDKQTFLSELARLNAVRNRIMHPVRGYRPTRGDFDFVKDFAARMFAEDTAPTTT